MINNSLMPRPHNETATFLNSFIAHVILCIGYYTQYNYGFVPGIIITCLGFIYLYATEWYLNKKLTAKSSSTHQTIISLSKLQDEHSDWVTVTDVEFERLKEKIAAISRFNSNSFDRLICDREIKRQYGFVVWGVIVSLLFILFGHISEQAQLFLFNLLVLAFLWMELYRPRIWIPQDISFKLPLFEKLVEMFDDLGLSCWERTFQFNLKPFHEKKIPIDLKMVLKPPKAPKEFYGVQVQASKNRGGKYVYFVIVTKSSLPIAVPTGTESDVIAPKYADGVNILIIRQYADEYGGYITTDGDVKRLLNITLEAVRKTLG